MIKHTKLDVGVGVDYEEPYFKVLFLYINTLLQVPEGKHRDSKVVCDLQGGAARMMCLCDADVSNGAACLWQALKGKKRQDGAFAPDGGYQSSGGYQVLLCAWALDCSFAWHARSRACLPVSLACAEVVRTYQHTRRWKKCKIRPENSRQPWLHLF